MTGPVFVDTNLLIYCLDEANPSKYQSARLWRAELWKSRLGRVSFQVLQEFYWVATRKWPALRREVQAEIRDLFEWQPVVIDSQILQSSWKIQERYKISFWDGLIVSAAKAASCRYLLTEDLQPEQELDGVIVVNPFRCGPNEIAN
jgi:predicted nucleic acid-binding protein